MMFKEMLFITKYGDTTYKEGRGVVGKIIQRPKNRGQDKPADLMKISVILNPAA